MSNHCARVTFLLKKPTFGGCSGIIGYVGGEIAESMKVLVSCFHRDLCCLGGVQGELSFLVSYVWCQGHMVG
jgi:hypothetical protein